MRSLRTFRQRMAALEALEAQQATVAQLPDVDAMDDGDVVWEAILGLRGYLLAPQLTAPCGPFAVWALYQNSYRAYWEAIAARVNPLFASLSSPVLLLARWEVEDAIAAIDAGQVMVTWSERGNGVRQFFRLWPAWPKDGGAYDADVLDTCNAIDHAYRLVQHQRHYPQPRDFRVPELTTLPEWRAWLEGCYA